MLKVPVHPESCSPNRKGLKEASLKAGRISFLAQGCNRFVQGDVQLK